MKTFFIIYKKMNKEIITSADIEIEKLKFCHCINLILSKDVDIDNILIFSIISSSEKKGYKYFIGYKDDDDYKIKPLGIMLPETSTYVKKS